MAYVVTPEKAYVPAVRQYGSRCVAANTPRQSRCYNTSSHMSGIWFEIRCLTLNTPHPPAWSVCREWLLSHHRQHCHTDANCSASRCHNIGSVGVVATTMTVPVNAVWERRRCMAMTPTYTRWLTRWLTATAVVITIYYLLLLVIGRTGSWLSCRLRPHCWLMPHDSAWLTGRLSV